MNMAKNKIILILSIFLLTTNCGVAATSDPVLIDAVGYTNYAYGNYTAALDCYQKTLSIMPTSSVAFDGIGDIFMKNKDYYKAYLAYKKADSLNKRDSIYKLHAQRAIYFALIESMKNPKNYPTDKQKIEKSIKFISNIITYEPKNICAIKLLCDFHILNNNYPQALNVGLLGLSINENNYELNKKVSDIYSCLNRSKDASIFSTKAEKFKKTADKFY